MAEAALRIGRFDDPDERRDFPLGQFELIEAGGLTIGRAVSIHFLGAEHYSAS